MIWHGVTIAGYLLVVAGIVVLQLLATRTEVPVPSFGELLTRAMRSRTAGRVGLDRPALLRQVAGWAT